MVRGKMLIYGFNEARKNISDGYLKVGYESMSAISFWTTAKGNLPHLSNIFRNPDPLGIEFNTVAYYVIGALLFIEIHRLN